MEDNFAVFVIAAENVSGLLEAIAQLPGFLTLETLEEDLSEQGALSLVERIDAGEGI